MSIRDVLLAILVVAIWGFNFVMIKVGVAEVPPLFFNAIRFSLVILPWIFFVKRPNTSWLNIFAFGMFLGVIQFGFLFTAMSWGMNASLSSVLLQSQAFFTILFAFIYLREIPKTWQIGGAIFASIGIFALAVDRYEGGTLVPFLMIIVAASSWGAANIVTKRAGQIDMLGFVVWASAVPPIPLLLLSLWLEDHTAIYTTVTQPSSAAIAAAFYVAYPTTILGFGIWGHLLKKYPASLVAPFSLLVPIFGVVSGMLVLGETMSPLAIVSGAIIFVGLLINVFGGKIFSQKAEALKNQA